MFHSLCTIDFQVSKRRRDLFSKHCVICWIHGFLLSLEWKSNIFVSCTMWKGLPKLGSRKKSEQTLQTGWVWADLWRDGPAGASSRSPPDFLVHQGNHGPFSGWTLVFPPKGAPREDCVKVPLSHFLRDFWEFRSSSRKLLFLQNKKEKRCMFEPIMLPLKKWA